MDITGFRRKHFFQVLSGSINKYFQKFDKSWTFNAAKVGHISALHASNLAKVVGCFLQTLPSFVRLPASYLLAKVYRGIY